MSSSNTQSSSFSITSTPTSSSSFSSNPTNSSSFSSNPTSSSSASNTLTPTSSSSATITQIVIQTTEEISNQLISSFIGDKTTLDQNETIQIFNSISSEPPVQITNLLRIAGVLTLNSNPEPIEISTPDFSYHAQKISNDSISLNLSTLQVEVPSINIPNTAVSLISWNTNPYVSNTTIDSKVVSISVSDLSGKSISIRNLTVPLQLKWNINISSNDPRLNCTKNCTYVEYEAKCLYWNETLHNWDDSGCYFVYASLTSIICNCTHMTDFSSRFLAVYSDNKATFNNAKLVYSDEGLQRFQQFYITFGAIGLLGIITFIFGVYLDIKSTKNYYEVLLKDHIIKDLKEKTGCLIDKCNEYEVSNVVQPQIKNHIHTPDGIQKFFIIWYTRIYFQHSHLSAFFKFDPRLPRLFRLMTIFIGQFNSLFLSALLYGFKYGSGTNLPKISIIETIVLSIITAIFNVPSLAILFKLMNTAGMAEFTWRYPILVDELKRRHKFEKELELYTEDELNISKHNLYKYTNIVESNEHIHEIDHSNNSNMGISEYIFLLICCKRKEQIQAPKGSIKNAFNIANKDYVIVKKAPSYYAYFPFHTLNGLCVFMISFGWFIWCLNYLLLFAASHKVDVSNSMLYSFGISELTTIIITQPLTLLIMLGVGYLLKYLINKNIIKLTNINLPSLYYFSDPFINQYSTLLSSSFAFRIFLNGPAEISYKIENISNIVKNLGHAPFQGLLDMLDDEHKKYIVTEKEKKIIELYELFKDKERLKKYYNIIDIDNTSDIYIKDDQSDNQLNNLSIFKINKEITIDK